MVNSNLSTGILINSVVLIKGGKLRHLYTERRWCKRHGEKTAIYKPKATGD